MPDLSRYEIDVLPEDDDAKYAFGRLLWRTYFYRSKDAQFKAGPHGGPPDEWDAVRVVDSDPALVWMKSPLPGPEAALVDSESVRQQWRVTFVRTPRKIKRVQVQQWSVSGGKPISHRSISIPVEALPKLIAFFRYVAELPENQVHHKARIDDEAIGDIIRRVSEDAAAAQDFVREYPQLVAAIRQSKVDEAALVRLLGSGQAQASEMLNAVLSSGGGKRALLDRLVSVGVTEEEIANLTYRKEQLEVFRRLLHDEAFFTARMRELSQKQDKREGVWQDFLEKNRWIFGYGLKFQWLSGVDEGEPLEFNAIGGDRLEGAGVRMDSILKTRGKIASLCFVEIKHHRTDLLKQTRSPYRGEAWLPSEELAGGVAQVQRAVWKAMQRPLDQWHDLGVDAPVQPKSILVVGSLTEFEAEQRRINKEKFRSFELFRANTSSPEIITFDELYERCRFIVEAGDDTESICGTVQSVPAGTVASEFTIDDADSDDIPF
jgi:hypothetical protein